MSKELKTAQEYKDKADSIINDPEKQKVVNVRTKNLKNVTNLQSEYLNKYYVYAADIYQITNINIESDYVTITFEKPNKKIGSKIISIETFKDRKLFDFKSEAENYLFNEWIIYNVVPKYKQLTFSIKLVEKMKGK